MSDSTALVFDIDDTLTEPRKQVEPEMTAILMALQQPFYLAAGSDLSIVQNQLLEPLHAQGFRGRFDGFLCNGAIRYRCDLTGATLQVECIRDFSFAGQIGADAMAQLLALIEETLVANQFPVDSGVEVIGDLIIDRGAMINIAPAGRPSGALSERAHENRAAFEAYDTASGYRERVLAHLRSEIAKIPNGDQIYVSLGGKTSFDVVIQGNDKSYPMETVHREGFQRVVYFGDALFPGGNDEAVLKLIERVGSDCPYEAIRVDGWPSRTDALKEQGFA